MATWARAFAARLGWIPVLTVLATVADRAEAAFSYRKSLTIDSALVSGPADLANFPVLVSTTLPPAHVAHPKGLDIIFRAEDAATCGGASPCRLDHEIESYVSATGALVAWVRVPVLRTSVDTVIFVYYGDASVTCPQTNPSGVWDSGFRDVFHLNETGDHTDSTVNRFSAVAKGAVSTGAAGLFGTADDFVGPAESRLIASDGVQTANSPFTYEVWFRMDVLQNQFIGLVTKGRDEQPGPNFDWTGLWIDSTNRPFLGWFGGTGGNLTGPAPLTAGPWYYLAATYDASQLRVLYVNGFQVAADGPGPTYADIPQYTRIGDDSNGQYLDGRIDEVRVSTAARSPDWIQTTWNNLSNAAAFFNAMGVEDPSPPPVSVTCGPAVSACAGGGPAAGACNLRSIGTATDYAVGSVTATNGSHIVTGAGGTTWLASNRGRGDRIQIEGVSYTVAAVDSDTQLRITTPYAGATGSGKAYLIARQFTTLQAWEDCISGVGGACPFIPVASASLVSDNRSEIGIAYKDTPFTNGAAIVLLINGTTTDAAHTITLTADPGNRHNGIPGAGVVVNNDVSNMNVGIDVRDEYVTVEWMEVQGGGGPGSHGMQVQTSVLQPSRVVFAHNLIHHNAGQGIRYFTANGSADFYNNFIFRNTREGIDVDPSSMNPGSRVRILNNTFLANGWTAEIRGVNLPAFPWVLLRNNVIVDDGGSPDFNVLWPDVGSSHNLSGDAAPPVGPFNADLGHSPRGGGIYSATVAGVNFVNPAPPAENLHLQTGSTAIDAAASLAAIFPTDIDGAGRVGPWDVGADDLASPTPRGTGCPAGTLVGTNLLSNGDFPIPPGAAGFTTGVPYVGDDVQAWDTTVSIQTGAKNYNGGDLVQSTFPGDPSLGVAAATNWLFANGNTTGGPYLIWQRQVAVSPSTTYLFYFYASGVTAPGNPIGATDVPVLQFFRDGSTTSPFTPRGTQVGTDFSIPFETVAEGDLWTRFQYVFTTGPAQTSAVLSVWDAATGSFGDDVGITQIGIRGCSATTKVELESFTASPEDGAVVLSWRTASELDNLGFHLYRSTRSEGPWARITSAVIPGLGSSPSGRSYSFRDEGLRNGASYFYVLEDIETTGRIERHGPVAAVPTDSSAPAARRYGNPEASTFRVVSRSSRRAVIELATEGFLAFPRDDGTVRIEVPGFLDSDEDPPVPVRRVWLEAVAGRKVRILSVREGGLESFELQPAPRESSELSASRDGTQRLRRFRGAGTTPSMGGLVPPSPAWIASVGFQGDVKKTLLELAPLRWDRSRGRVVLARRLVVTIGFDGSEPLEVASRDGRTGRRERKTSPARGISARWAATEPGLYEIRFEDVFGRAVRGKVARFDGKSLRLSRLGVDVAYHREPVGKPFAPGSRLFFWSEGGTANPYGDEAVYELELGATGAAMPGASAKPAGPPLSTYWNTLVREEERYYQAALLEAEDRWLWEAILSGSVKSFTFAVRDLAPAGEPSMLEIFVQGASDFPESPDHHLRFYVNGAFAGEDEWNGKTRRRVSLDVVPGILREGENTLEIENVADTGARYSMTFLDRFHVTYRRRASAEDGRLEGSWPGGGTAEVSSLGGPAYVLDVTQETPRWLSGGILEGGTLRFRVSPERSYAVVDAAAVKRPEARQAPVSRWRLSSRRADYVALGPAALLDTAKPLLDYRRGEGLAVAAVPIDEIFDEFGHGERRPEAIRDFLAYAYHHWQGGIRYVLLLGDASYDFKNHLGTGAPNPVPALAVETSYLWTASDPAYVSVNGDDLLPDVAIGRLPAADEGELRIMIDKILAHERGGALLAGPVVLVTDDPDSAGDFDRDAAELLSSVLSTRDVRRISLSALGVSETRRAVLEAFEEGASLVDYIGHGGIHLWASENIFDTDAVARLGLQGRHPLVLAFDCLNGYFHFPFFDSLGEELLKAEGRGALAVLAPSGLSLNAPAHELHERVLDELLNHGNARLGDAVASAQERFLETGHFPELLAIYHLFGDPALSLR